MQNFNPKFKTDLNARCYQLSLQVLGLADTLPNKRSAWIIADQLIRAITSIGANLVEARASRSRLECKKFYEISLKSANESKYWLGLLRDTRIADAVVVNPILKEVVEIANMLAKGVMSLKRKP